MTTDQTAARDEQRVNTEYGPLTVDTSLLKLWNKYGWPEDRVLRQMVEQQREARP
jgi:hypothetical protein